MTAALADQTRDLAIELNDLFGELDRQRFRRELAEALEARLARVRARVEAMELPGRRDALATRLSELREQLAESAPTRDDGKRAWIAFRTRVQPTYEAIAAALRADSVHVPSLRPTNHARKFFHVLNATVGLLILELAPWPIAIGTAAAFFAAGWALEGSRRLSPRVNEALMGLFAKVAHPHEAHRINSATWYTTALLVLSMTEQRIPCALALVALGLGDPAAAMVGRRFGRVRVMNGRTLEGSLAFVGASLAGSLALLTLAHGMSLGAALIVGLSASVAGALAELVVRRIDDNLAVPLLAFCGAALALFVVG